MICPHCNKSTPDDSKFCEFCGFELNNHPPTPLELEDSHENKKTRKKRTNVLKFIAIIASILLAIAAIWTITLKLTQAKIILADDGKFDVYKDYIAYSREDYTLLNDPNDSYDEIEIPLSDISGNWYMLVRTFINDSSEFSTEAEYTAILEAKDEFHISFTSSLYNGYNADGSEFKPSKWALRKASGSFYQNVLAFYFPGKRLELVYFPNRQMYGEPGRFIDVAYDEKSIFGKKTLYQVTLIKLP